MAFSLRRALLVVLLPALLLAQTLGLLHATLHGHAALPSAPVAQALQAGQTAQPGQSQPAKGWVAELFGNHADASACRLYDQSAHGDAAGIPPAPTVVVLHIRAVPSFFLLPAAVLAAVAPFDARGPPALR